MHPTSRRIDCKDIKSRYFFLPSSNLLIHQSGSVITLGRRDDVLWQSLDTSNVMLAQANSIKHYHGTLDGLDVLSMIPEYTKFDETGVSFTALDKQPDPMTPQSWWAIYQWYFYGTALSLAAFVCLCGLTYLCSCANGCLFKLCCTPCRVICKQCNNRYFKRHGASRTSETINSDNQLVTRSLLIQPPLSIAADQPEVRFENSTVSPTRKTPN